MTKQEKAEAKRKRRARGRHHMGFRAESFSYYGTWNARPEAAEWRRKWNKRREEEKARK